jgi:two-component system, response regulator YesN
MYKVLIADDEPLILEGIESIINWEEMGLEIVGKVLDGSEAIKVAERTKVDIIITDIKMPVMDGLELIRTVRDKGLNSKFVILSGYNDFEYVKKAITLGIENYLLKPVNKDEMKSTLINTIEKIENELLQKIHQREDMNVLKQNLLYRWVTNAISIDELLDKSELVGISLNYQQFAVSIVKILHNKKSSSKYQNNSSLMVFAVYNICSEIISQGNSGICFCDLSGNVVLVFMDGNLDKGQMNQVLENCMANINKYLELDIFISTGEIQPDLDSVHLSYAQSRELQDYFLVMPSNTRIDYETIGNSSVDGNKINEIDIKCLQDIITSKNKDRITDFLDAIFNRPELSQALSRPFAQSIAVEILFSISNYIKKNSVGSAPRFENLKMSFSSSLSVKSLEDVRKWLQQVLSATIDFISSEEANANPLVKQVLTYINANYTKELSMKSLSDTFKVNAAHLGQLLKKETGEMFSDYLNRIRVEKAMELLSNTDLKAGKISEMVGYLDSNHFFKCFKKVTGISPTEYRNRDGQVMKH